MAKTLDINGVRITNPADIAKWEIANEVVLAVQNRFLDAQRTGQPTADLRQELAAAKGNRQAIENVIIPNAQAASAPPNSTGQTTAQAQRARDDGANTQNPPRTPLTAGPNGRVQSAAPTTTPTNARPPTTAPTSGTNAPTRPSSATQAVPPPTATPNAGQIPGNYPGTIANLPPPGPQATPTRSRGAAAGIDDIGGGNEVLQRLQTLYSGAAAKIPTQANALSRYGSYTYNVGLYILKPEQYNTYITSKRITIPNGQLLMASGGAPLSANSQPPTNNNMQTGSAVNRPGVDLAAGRSQYFPLDFYIDDVQLKGIINGKGSRSAHNIFEVDFKITEPNGISLLDNLYKATEEIMGDAPNYASQIFLMVINFWGYDENGTLTPAVGIDPNDPTKTTTPIVKYIPFIFKNIKFRVSNKLVEYTCSAYCPQNAIGSSQNLGTIPYNVELTAETMTDIFNGASAVTNAPDPAAGRQPQAVPNAGAAAPAGAPPKAGAAPKPTITSGIIDAMNKFEKEKVQEGKFEHANVYEVVFTDSILAEAKLVPPGSTDKSTTPMGPNNATPAQQLNPAAGSVNSTAKNNSATAGTTLLQFMDKTLSASSYIINQQNAIIDPETGDRIPQRPTASLMGWYRIGLQAVPIAYDNKRNDYAYKITYQISPYLVNGIDNPYFPKGVFRGVHKSYKYWFTGENTEIVDYNADFNFLYFTVINSKQEPTDTNDYRYAEYAKRKFQTKANENIQAGTSEDVTEPAAQAKDNLYSPSDLVRAHLTILGDPAWIQQGELGTGIAGPNFNYNPYLPDGTINPEGEEILFEIAWNKPVDYSLETGLIEPGQRRYGANDLVTDTGSKETTQSYIYKAVTINSTFSKGKFTQQLEGVRIMFPLNSIKRNKTGAEVPAASPGQADSDLAEQQLQARNAGTAVTSRTAVAANYPGAIANPNVIATPTAPGPGTRPVAITNRSAEPPVNPARVAPAPPAKPPTSGGTPVGPANPVTPTNTQTGGTVVRETTRTTADPNILREKDPASYAKYKEYEAQQRALITQSEIARLTAQAKATNPNGIITAEQQSNIVDFATLTAADRAAANAAEVFAPQFAAAGAGGTTTTTTPANTTPVNTTAGQIMNRQP